MTKEGILFNMVHIFNFRCDKINKLHCYETTERDGEVGFRCDYNKESTFVIQQFIDEETEEVSYIYIDYHDSDGPIYKKCDIDTAIEIVRNSAREQEVYI